MRLEAKDFSSSDAPVKLLKRPPLTPLEEGKQRLRASAEQLGIEEAKIKKTAGVREIVHAAGDLLIGDGDPAVLYWRIASGLSHGDAWASHGTLGQSKKVTFDGIQHIQLSAPTEVVIEMTAMARSMVDNAWNLYRRQAMNHLT